MRKQERDGSKYWVVQHGTEPQLQKRSSMDKNHEANGSARESLTHYTGGSGTHIAKNRRGKT